MKQQFSICVKQPNNHLENLSIMEKADTKNPLPHPPSLKPK